MPSFQVRLERGVLPHGHERRTDAVLDDAVRAVQSQGLGARKAVHTALEAACLEDSAAVYAALDDTTRERVDCVHIPRVCVAAHIVDRAAALWSLQEETQSDADGDLEAEAPEWYGQCVELALKWLQGQVAVAAEDTLQDVAEVRFAS